MNSTFRPIVIGAALAALLSCGGADAPKAPDGPAPVQITAADREAAKTRFSTVCFTCHGMSGKGDGPASTGLVPNPRNFTDTAWQESVTDQHIEKIIVGGGLAVGKAVTMPANPDLNGKPGVVAALREHIRSLAKKESN